MLRRTGGEVPMTRGPRPLVARARDRRRSRLPAASRWTPRICSTSSTRRGTTAKPKGIVHTTGRLPRRRRDDPPLRLRPQARDRRLLVRGRRRLGDRPQLHRLRAALQRRRPRSCTRGRPTSPTRTAGGRSSSATASTILYTAPTAIRTHMKWGPEYAAAARPLEPAPARLGRRADQPRGVDLVPASTSAAAAARSSTPGGRPRPG